MTDNKPENETPENQPGDDTIVSVDMAGSEDGAPAPDDRLVQLESENAELKDRALRLMADMENLRRRTAKEVKDASQYAVTAFARDMLGVGDNLRRALDAVPQELAESADGTLKALLEGVGMTEREMLNALEKHGIRILNPEGEKFDPNFHQAMFEVPNPQVPNGTVVQVVQAGYVIGERVLRPAMVGVAKGGPKGVRPAESDAGESPEAPSGTAEEDPTVPGAGAHVNKTA